jgi:putative hemolysin
MAPFPWLDACIIAGLILLNGFFAMSELAIVSARRPRLRGLADRGSVGARTALALAEDSSRFLSGVQIGITLVGIINGAYSGATLARPVGDRLALWFGLPTTAAEEIGFAVVIVIATYLSLIVGELVPKQFALPSPCVLHRSWCCLPGSPRRSCGCSTGQAASCSACSAKAARATRR